MVGEKFFPCDDVVLAIGQDNAFPWIERDLGIEFDKWDVPVVDPVKHAPVDVARACSSAATRFRAGKHHLGRRARAPVGDLDPQALPGPGHGNDRLPDGQNLVECQDGYP